MCIIFVDNIVNFQSTPEDNDQVKRARCVSVLNHLHGLYFKDIIYFEDIIFFVIMFLEQLAEEKLSNISICISVAKSVITQIIPFHGFSFNPFAPISNNNVN